MRAHQRLTVLFASALASLAGGTGIAWASAGQGANSQAGGPPALGQTPWGHSGLGGQYGQGGQYGHSGQNGPGGYGQGGQGQNGQGGPQATGAVFVQSDNLLGNEVTAFARAADGVLSQAGTYKTGGLGGALEGSAVDHLASQGSLAYDPGRGLLYAVNAGSDTVTVFAVQGDHLTVLQTVPSGGSFPVSIAVQGDLVYVLNAEAGGAIQGFRVVGDRLVAIPGSNHQLELPTTTPRYTHTPGQIAFSPDGQQLLVTTKAATNSIEVFRLGPWGAIAGSATVDELPADVPFSLSFQDSQRLLVTEAGPNAVGRFDLLPDGTLEPLASIATGGEATCWIAAVGGDAYVANAGSATLTELAAGLGSAVGPLSVFGTLDTEPGPVDLSISSDGRFLYSQTGGKGIVQEYAIGPAGVLAPIGSVTVANAVGGEGIVAS